GVPGRQAPPGAGSRRPRSDRRGGLMSQAQERPLLEARGIVYRYGAINALKGVDLHVGRGEAVCVIGPNGAGKTTLARVAGGLYRPAKGTLLVNGRPLSRRPHEAVARGIGSVLEGRHLFVEQNVRTNLELGCYHGNVPKQVVEERLERVMDLF